LEDWELLKPQTSHLNRHEAFEMFKAVLNSETFGASMGVPFFQTTGPDAFGERSSEANLQFPPAHFQIFSYNLVDRRGVGAS